MKRAHTVALITALYLVSAAPAANAQDVFSLIQNMAGKYALSWTDLDSRRAQLETEINNAAAGRQITAAQAADFRTELTRITAEINQAKASGKRLGITQSINLSNQINVLAGSLGDAIQNKVSSLPDIDALQTQLNTQIDTALQAGQLSATTATNLKSELQQIATIEAAYKADTGSNLTPRQVEILGERLNTAKGHIEQEIRISQSAIPALTERRTTIETKIQTGLNTGRITASEAEAFRRDLAVIAQQQSTFQAGSNGLLTGSQVLTLAQSLDQLDDRVSLRVVGGTGTAPILTAEIDALRNQISARINQLVTAGRLPSSVAAEDVHDLDQLASLTTAYSNAVGGITPAQVQRIQADLLRLNSKIDTQILASAGGGTTAGGTTTVETGSTTDGGATGGFNVGSLPIISQKSFPDAKGYWGEQYVNELASRNVIGGFPNGTFGPNDEITRAQFAAIVVKALGLPPSTGGRNFTDVPAGHWAAGAITAASNAGLIGGFPDGTFRPGDNITRAQSLVILSKALKNTNSSERRLNRYSDAEAVPSWAKEAITQAANARIIVNFPDAAQIRPNALATRGEVAAMMYQALTALGANLPQVRIGVLGGGGRM